MIVDSEPSVNSDDRTITVKSTINQDEEVSISLNGLMAVYLDDIENIDDKTITILEGVTIDWDLDSIWVVYTEA